MFAISPRAEADHPGGNRNPSPSLTTPTSILPRIQQIDAGGGEVGLVASNDREAAPERGGGDQAKEAPIPSICCELGTQAFVDQEPHEVGGRSSKLTTVDETGGRRLHGGALRRRPRRG